jgi:hypothetical protein
MSGVSRLFLSTLMMLDGVFHQTGFVVYLPLPTKGRFRKFGSLISLVMKRYRRPFLE